MSKVAAVTFHNITPQKRNAAQPQKRNDTHRLNTWHIRNFVVYYKYGLGELFVTLGFAPRPCKRNTTQT